MPRFELVAYDVPVIDSWERRIRRAECLAAAGGPASALLRFYARLLSGQRALYDAFDNAPLSGELDHDSAWLAEHRSAVFGEVIAHGPQPLAAEARALMDDGSSATKRLLLAYWHDRSDHEFFAKSLWQPYCQWLADRGRPFTSSQPDGEGARCPRCGGAPQLAVLEASGLGEGGNRQLQCATCLSTWPFARVVCPGCGEQDEKRIGYFQSSAFDYVRVDVCDRCRRYLKTIDLERLGVAVPLVDEVAAASLDVWARDQDYQKIELNLIGL